MSAEFDRYATEYENLLKDPIRDKFVGGTDFFHRRKWFLLRDFFHSRGLDMSRRHWLDVGCGKGELLGFGRDSFASVSGCEMSSGMICNIQGVEVRQQLMPSQLPFKDSQFDLVTAVCVYHHVELEDRAALTAEVRRVLKPGGIFAMIEHNPFNPVTAAIVKRSPVDVNARLLTPALSRSLSRAAGLSAVATTYFLYLPERLYGPLRLLESMASRIPLGGQYAVFSSNSPGQK